VHCVSDHLKVAEQRKLDSQAWKNYSGIDGLSTRFEPLALGWHGDFGERFRSVCEELVTYHISQQQARNGGSERNQTHSHLAFAYLICVDPNKVP